MPAKSALLECHRATLPECHGHVYCDVIVAVGGFPARLAPCPPPRPSKHALGLAVKHRREELRLTQEELHCAPNCTNAGSPTSRPASATPATPACAAWLPALDLTASELLARAEQIEASGVSELRTPAAATG